MPTEYNDLLRGFLVPLHGQRLQHRLAFQLFLAQGTVARKGRDAVGGSM